MSVHPNKKDCSHCRYYKEIKGLSVPPVYGICKRKKKITRIRGKAGCTCFEEIPDQLSGTIPYTAGEELLNT